MSGEVKARRANVAAYKEKDMEEKDNVIDIPMQQTMFVYNCVLIKLNQLPFFSWSLINNQVIN